MKITDIKLDKELIDIISKEVKGYPCSYCGGETVLDHPICKYSSETCKKCKKTTYFADKMFPRVSKEQLKKFPGKVYEA